ncbi:MAG: hypothetical protein HY280_05175 [Nitrospinae bacterium]|nr:hypothetical protein [Nitrospinota bacterium]
MKKVLVTTLVSAMVLGAGVSFAYDEGAVANGGKITGQIKFAGTAPKLDPIKVQKNQDFCGNSVAAEGLQVNGGGVKFGVVYIEKIAAGKAIDRAGKTDLAETKCVFRPHVIAVVKGTDISINNDDTILHNINISIDGIQRYNKGQPKQNQILVTKLRNVGVADMTCDSHTHMKGWGVVLDHPYFSVSNDKGEFSIGQVPAGKYNLKMWHENWKVKNLDDDGRPIYDTAILQTKEVTVTAGGTASVNFEIK